MKLLVSHMSALRYWRSASALEIELTKPCRLRSARRGASGLRDVLEFRPKDEGFIMSDDFPLDVLVLSNEARRRSGTIAPHQWSAGLAYGSFVRLRGDSDIYVSTPEFVFAQLANELNDVELARLGNELCGKYSLAAGSGFTERSKSLTTKAKLSRYVNRMPESSAQQRALKALAWVADGCASPQETNLLLVLCLPTRLGGFGLPLPMVNPKLKVSKRLQKYVEGSMYKPDFAWRITVNGKRTVVTVEYDSHEHHDSEEAAEATRIRRNDFKTMGALVTSINRSQLEDARRLEVAVRQIMRDLGQYRKPLTTRQLYKTDDLLAQLAVETVR